MKGSKRFLFLFALGIVFMSFSVISIWYFGFTGSTGFEISSSVPLTFVSGFALTNVTSGENVIEKTEEISLTNDDGSLDMNVSIITTRDDAVDSCGDYLNDATITAFYNGALINHADNLSILNGLTILNVTTSLKPFSCEGNVSTEIILTPK